MSMLFRNNNDNDNGDKYSIFGTIGSIGLTSAVGYYGIKELKRRREVFSKVSSDVEKAISLSKSKMTNKLSSKLYSNVKGLEDVMFKKAVYSISSTELANSLISGKFSKEYKDIASALYKLSGKNSRHVNKEVADFFSGLNKVLSKHINAGGNLEFNVVNGEIQNVFLNFKGRKIKLGVPAIGGISSLPGERKIFYRKFMHPNYAQSIISGQAQDVFTDAMHNNILNINQAKLEAIDQAFRASGGDIKRASAIANRNISSLLRYGSEIPTDGRLLLSHRKQLSSVVPMFFNPSTGGLENITPYNENVQKYLKMIDKYYKDLPLEEKRRFPIFSLLSEQNEIGSGILLLPSLESGKIKDKVLARFINAAINENNPQGIGTTAFRQIQNRNMRFVDRQVPLEGSEFFSAIKGATNLQKVRTYVIHNKKAQQLYNQLIGLTGKAGTFLNEEGAIYSQSLLNKEVENLHSKIIKFNVNTADVKLTRNFDRIVLHALAQNNSFNDIKFNKKVIREMLRDMAADPAYREQIYKEFANAYRSGKIGPIDLRTIFGRKTKSISLAISPMGPTKINTNNIITGFAPTEEGLSIKMIESAKFREVLKSWGSSKVVGAGENTYKAMKAIAWTTVLDKYNIYDFKLYSKMDYQTRRKINKEVIQIFNKMKNNPDFMITMDVRNDLSGGLDVLRKKAQDIAKKTGALNFPNIYGEEGNAGVSALEGFLSPGDTLYNMGIFENGITVNPIMYRKLKTQGYTEAAEALMIGMEENLAYAKNINEQILPVLSKGPLPSKYMPINADNLSTEDINTLFGEDIEKARKLAISEANSNLANKLTGMSEDTIFYIQAGDERLPIPLFESKYTGSGKVVPFEDESKEVRSQLNNAIRRYIINKQRGENPEVLADSMAQINQAVKAAMSSKMFFTHRYDNALTRVFIGNGIFEDSFLNEAKKVFGQEKGLNKILSENFGLTLNDMATKSMVAVGDDRTFFNLASKTGLGKDIISSMKASEHEILKNKELFTSFAKEFMKKQGTIITGRNPVYPIQGITVSRLLHAGIIADTLKNPVTGEKIFSTRGYEKGTVFLNKVAQSYHAADLDFDPIFMMAISNKELDAATREKYKNYQSFLDEFMATESKGGLKGSIFNENWLKTASEMGPGEAANTAARSISQYYNAIIPYNLGFNPYISESMFEASEHFTPRMKMLGLSSMLELLPEKAIGKKTALTAEQADEILQLLDENGPLSPKQKAQKFKQIFSLKDKNNFDLVQELSDKELEKFFAAGSKIDRHVVKLARDQISSTQEAASMYRYLMNQARTGESRDILENALVKTRATRAAATEAIVESGDMIRSIFEKIKSNKKLVAIGAATLLGGYLMRSPMNTVKNQEAREEARRKSGRKFPGEGQGGINPPTGVVGKIQQAINYNVYGDMGENASYTDVSLANAMYGNQNGMMVINQSNPINSRYLYELQEEHSQNNWNA